MKNLSLLVAMVVLAGVLPAAAAERCAIHRGEQMDGASPGLDDFVVRQCSQPSN
jgi:hypothetical protein